MRTVLDEKANTSSGGWTEDDPGAVIRWDDAERFFVTYQAKGRTQETVKKYRR